MRSPLILFRLIKLPIILLSTLSGVTGFHMGGDFSFGRIALFMISLAFLAAGSASLNHYQDRDFDKLMERTRERPIPAGTIDPLVALCYSLFLIIAGLLSMFFFFGKTPVILGLLTVILYNGIYTYLKRYTRFAVLPGALVGALPPLIGWTAAGTDYLSTGILGLMLFFFIWQIPHFWLLLSIHSSEYRNAGYPIASISKDDGIFSGIIFTWIAALIISALVLRFYGLYSHLVSIIVISVFSLWTIIYSLPLLKNGMKKKRTIVNIFKNINLFALLMMLIVFAERGVF